ncbi:MAG: glycosyltransferase [Planctomycetota bacterium]
MKLLVVEPRSLFPPDSGAKILSANMLRHLCREHDVTLVFNRRSGETKENSERMAGLGAALVPVSWREMRNFTPRFYLELGKCLFTGKLYSVNKFCTPELKLAAAEAAARVDFDAVIWDTISAFMPDVDFGASPRVALDHNVEYRLRERQAERAGRGPKAAYLRHYARKTKEFEVGAFRKADHVVTVSPADADYIRGELGIEHVSALPPGVDADYFSPGEPEAATPGIVFTGSMDWQSNQDAVTFFVREVLPKIKQERPRVRFTIVGRRPPAHVRALAEADPDHVEVTGTVGDVRPYLARAQVAAVPVLFGSGLKIKVFEAMAMAKPVVVSTIGAEGLPLVSGDNVLIADTPADMAARCLELLGDPGLRKRIGERARATVLDGHDWSVVAAELAKICESVARRRAGP